MLNISRSDVTDAPFPHVIKQGLLDPQFYQSLRADFPTQDSFAEQTELSGGAGSRTGKGTGFDIYRGDDAYTALIGRSAAWKEFDSWINSPSFVEKFAEIFGPDLDRLGCAVTVDPQAYDHDYVEGREVLTEKPTLASKAREFTRKILPAKSPEHMPIFSRLDVERSVGGYLKPPHCDRQNRLCSLILYFTDLAAKGIEGGDLSLFRHKNKTDPVQHERHPRPEDVETVATLRPTENLGVFFPCSNNSYHGVSALQSQSAARDFLYINLSVAGHSAWR